jgi:hypothetical protein
MPIGRIDSTSREALFLDNDRVKVICGNRRPTAMAVSACLLDKALPHGRCIADIHPETGDHQEEVLQ